MLVSTGMQFPWVKGLLFDHWIFSCSLIRFPPLALSPPPRALPTFLPSLELGSCFVVHSFLVWEFVLRLYFFLLSSHFDSAVIVHVCYATFRRTTLLLRCKPVKVYPWH